MPSNACPAEHERGYPLSVRRGEQGARQQRGDEDSPKSSMDGSQSAAPCVLVGEVLGGDLLGDLPDRMHRAQGGCLAIGKVVGAIRARTEEVFKHK